MFFLISFRLRPALQPLKNVTEEMSVGAVRLELTPPGPNG